MSDFFVAYGYLGPYAAMSPDEMAPIRREIEEQVLTTDDPIHARAGQSRHMDQPVVYDLATHPAIIDRIAGLLGPDLVVWRPTSGTSHRAAWRSPGIRTLTSGRWSRR